MTRADEIEEAAAKWLIQLDLSGSPEKWAALDAWLAASPRHRAAFLRLSVAWRRMDALKRARPLSGEVDPDLLIHLPDVSRSPTPRAWPRWAARIAAAAAAIAALTFAVVLWHGGRLGETYTVDLDRPAEEITLEDGSSVTLNTGTRLRVTYSDSERHIRLERGEALFVVERDESWPFQVEAGSVRVRAVGTAFSVRVHDRAQVSVLISEGRVALEHPVRATLDAGELATIRKGRLVRRELSAKELVRDMSWTRSRLDFEGKTLAEAVAAFNRYNRLKLTLGSPQLGSLPVTGIHDALDLETFARALATSHGLRATFQDPLLGRAFIRIDEGGSSARAGDGT